MIKFELGYGRVLAIPKEEILNFLMIQSKGCVNLAEQVIKLHLVGLSYFDDPYYSKSIKQLKVQFVSIREVIDDVELLHCLNIILDYLQVFEKNDKQIIYEYANYFKLVRPDKYIDVKNVKRKVHVLRMQNVNIPNGVLSISKEYKSYLSKIQCLVETIEERVKYLSSFK